MTSMTFTQKLLFTIIHIIHALFLWQREDNQLCIPMQVYAAAFIYVDLLQVPFVQKIPPPTHWTCKTHTSTQDVC